MSKGVFVILATLFLCAGAAWGATAVPVSPGDSSGTAMTDQVCPTFSWSLADGAVSYRVEVYEQATIELLPYETMSEISEPMSVHEISAPALSWTPSSGECLSRGMQYVWYVRGVDRDGEGQWSEGRGFQVEASSLSVEQKDAVKEVVKSYLSGEAAKTASASAITSITQPAVTSAVNVVSDAGTGTTSGSEVRQVQAAGSAGVQINDNLDITGNLSLPTTTASTGIIYSGASRLIHSYGTANFFAGLNAGNFSGTGYDNAGVGYSALAAVSSGSFNTALGTFALPVNSNGQRNTALGCGALQKNISGGFNTAVGNAALYDNTSSNNTAVGTSALDTNTTGSNNTAIGYNADVASNNLTNAAAIGANAIVGQSNSLVLGGTEANAVNVGIGTTTPGFVLDINANTSIDSMRIAQSGSGNASIGFLKSAKVTTVGNTGSVGFLATESAMPLVFNTGNMERMRIDDAGNVYISNLLNGQGWQVCVVDMTGRLGFCASDERLKKEVMTLSERMDVLQALSRLRGVFFKWNTSKEKAGNNGGSQQIGFIAQEVEKVIPEMVHTDKDGYKSMDYGKLTAFLIEVNKAQQKQMVAQQEEIGKQRDRIAQLENKNSNLAATLNEINKRLAAIEGPSRTVAENR